VLAERERVYLAALKALVLGDSGCFGELFTEDVVVCSPHLEVASLRSAQEVLGSPDDALSDVEITVLALDAADDRLMAEWRLDATFARPVLYDDRVLIEPTGGSVRLSGASVAEFRGHRIRAFRHYFDDTELLAGVPGIPTHLRWSFEG
jgi:hypothetical protein